MSSAFDTINRQKLITVLETFLADDDVRIIRVLLSNTSLSLRVNNETTSVDTIIGTPQGDSLSPVLFVIYLEAALRELRPLLPTIDIPPNELAYADDVDFIFPTREIAENALPIIVTTLKKWNLLVNESKTDYTTISKESTEWHNTKKLGTLLGESEEIKHRKGLATAALNSMIKTYARPNKVSEEKRLRLYNALVLPILTYNSATWAITPTLANSLDSFHRRQLRYLLGVRYPDIITNVDLYQRCGTKPLSLTIRSLRWNLFGHILRRDNNIPAQLAMQEYFRPGTKHRGRPKTTLHTVLAADLKKLESHHLDQDDTMLDHSYAYETPKAKFPSVGSKDELIRLRKVASDRKLWKSMNAAYTAGGQAQPAKVLH